MSVESPPVERLGYPIPEVAEALGVSRETVRTWLRDQRVPKVKIGKRVLIPAWWLEDRLQGSRPVSRTDGAA